MDPSTGKDLSNGEEVHRFYSQINSRIQSGQSERVRAGGQGDGNGLSGGISLEVVELIPLQSVVFLGMIL